MKRAILICALAGMAMSARAQDAGKAPQKKDSVKTAYHRFMKISESDFIQVVQAFDEYKRLVMYDPATKENDKPKIYRNVDAFENGFIKRAKIDSVKIQPLKK